MMMRKSTVGMRRYCYLFVDIIIEVNIRYTLRMVKELGKFTTAKILLF
jgi:hypothetical protein